MQKRALLTNLDLLCTALVWNGDATFYSMRAPCKCLDVKKIMLQTIAAWVCPCNSSVNCLHAKSELCKLSKLSYTSSSFDTSRNSNSNSANFACLIVFQRIRLKRNGSANQQICKYRTFPTELWKPAPTSKPISRMHARLALLWTVPPLRLVWGCVSVLCGWFFDGAGEYVYA